MPRWRPRLLWVPMGLMLGGAAGAVSGMALLLLTTLLSSLGGEGIWGELVFVVVAGGFYGGVVGAAVGTVVGIEMAVLVGAHLPREQARRRARWLGHLLPPLTMLMPVVVTEGIDLAGLGGETAWWLFLLTAASVCGGPLARWVAGLQPHGPVVA